MTTDAAYIARMRAEADWYREQAEVAIGRHLKSWLLSRAAFFDQCAKEAEEDVPNENHERCWNCQAYVDECSCDGGIP